MAKPRDADPFAHLQALDAWPYTVNPPDDLVARDDRQDWVWQLAVNDVQVRPANAAGKDLDPDFAWPRLTIG